ncbi:hypothetical protein NEDG_01425 [Nematocida displodere]|uniref:Protein PNS1 n=1 Tax=Nematocida displodere TaxID=1805483 RepID=A0A177EDW2_9MICR|nr:hypothetical protein NEDG_01425 [Nematocida displodere]
MYSAIQKNRRLAASPIVCKGKFTDKACIPVALVIIGMLCFLALNGIDHKLFSTHITNTNSEQKLWPYVFEHIGMPIFSAVTAITIASIGIIFFPMALTHVSYWLLMLAQGFGILSLPFTIGENASGPSMIFRAIFLGISLATTIFLYIWNFKYIRAMCVILSHLGSVLVANVYAMLIFGVFSLAGFSALLGLLFLEKRSSLTQNTMFGMGMSAACLLGGFYCIIVLHASKVYFARVFYKDLENKALSKKESVARSAMKRTLLSSGTIFLASILSWIVFLARHYARRQLEQQINNSRNQNATFHIVIGMVIMFIITFILHLLDITLDMVNQYTLVYNALYGDAYVKSMKNAWEAQKSGLPLQLRSYSIVLIVPSTLSLIASIVGQTLYQSVQTGTYTVVPTFSLHTFAWAIPPVLVFFGSLTSMFIAFEYIYIAHYGLLTTGCPKLIIDFEKKLPA